MINHNRQPSGCMVLMAASFGAIGAVWLLGASIMVFGDACAAPCVVAVFVAVVGFVVPVFVVRNWPKIDNSNRGGSV